MNGLPLQTPTLRTPVPRQDMLFGVQKQILSGFSIWSAITDAGGVNRYTGNFDVDTVSSDSYDT